MAVKPKDVQFKIKNGTGKSDLTDWMRQMYDWGKRVRHDIVELEKLEKKKVGAKKGDPGDPPPPPDSGQ